MPSFPAAVDVALGLGEGGEARLALAEMSVRRRPAA